MYPSISEYWEKAKDGQPTVYNLRETRYQRGLSESYIWIHIGRGNRHDLLKPSSNN